MKRLVFSSIAALLCLLAEAQPATPFYCCDFSDSDVFASEWTIVNANSDYSTWQWNDWLPGSDNATGCVNCGWSGFGNDDYLLSQTFHLEAGAHYASFYVRSIRNDTWETFELCYGQESTDVKLLNVVAKDSVMSQSWRRKVVNFDIPVEGDYRLGFHCTSRGNNLILDDVCFGHGTLTLAPLITVRRLLLPDANCDLTDQTPVGVEIANEGTDTSVRQTLALSIDGGPYAEQDYNVYLPVDGVCQVWFDQRADLSDVGWHTLSVTARNEDFETDTINFNFRHIAPVTELPFKTNFSTGEDVSPTWTSRSNCWKYEPMGAAHVTDQLGPENALCSACMHLKGDIRLRFAYKAGGWVPNKRFSVRLGQAGTALTEWPVVYEDTLVDIQAKEIEIKVPIDNEGDYTLALVVDGTEKENNFYIYYLDVYAILPTDLQLLTVQTPLMPYIPEEQYRAEGRHAMRVVNHGYTAVSEFSTSLCIGDEVCLTASHEQQVNAGDSLWAELSGVLPPRAIGDIVNGLRFTVETIDETFVSDNSLSMPPIHVTDTVFATELLPKFEYGVGSGQESRFGNIFTLSTRDTLTSIAVGMAYDGYYRQRDMGVAIYCLENEGTTVGRCLWHTTCERGADEGIRLFTPPPMILEPGAYFVEVHQMTWNNLGVGIDYDTEYRLFYERMSDGQLRPIEGGGALAVRAHFGHGADAWSRDAGVVAFSRPVNRSAIFTESTEVDVVVRNYGVMTIDQMTVECRAGNSVSEQTVSLLPHEEKTLTFVFDLSEPGTYDVEARTRLYGDEHPQNDKATIQLTSRDILSPYTLDFESCNDFDYGHDFNPRWWSEDRLNMGTDGWAFYDYALKGMSVGFIAFDPLRATPEMLPEASGCYPHGGSRLGIAYCTSKRDHESDVWLVSPQLTLGDLPVLTFWVKGFKNEGWNLPERYRVLVSTTDDAFDSFTAVGDVREVPFSQDWQQVSVPLDDYAGEPVVYVALQYVSRALEGFFIMVDDISINSSYNSGINQTGTHSENSVVYDLQGRHISRQRQGLMLVRQSDGSVRKIVRR